MCTGRSRVQMTLVWKVCLDECISVRESPSATLLQTISWTPFCTVSSHWVRIVSVMQSVAVSELKLVVALFQPVWACAERHCSAALWRGTERSGWDGCRWCEWASFPAIFTVSCHVWQSIRRIIQCICTITRCCSPALGSVCGKG